MQAPPRISVRRTGLLLVLLNRVSNDQRKVCVQGQLAPRVQARENTPAVVHGSYILSFILVLLLQ